MDDTRTECQTHMPTLCVGNVGDGEFIVQVRALGDVLFVACYAPCLRPCGSVSSRKEVGRDATGQGQLLLAKPQREVGRRYSAALFVLRKQEACVA